MEKQIEKLFDRLDKSTCNFLAVKTIREELEENGFEELHQEDKWEIKPGGKYYLVKNGSAIFPFIVGTGKPTEWGARIIAAHSDSPCFKIKPNPEFYGDGGELSLNVEKYGGGILYTWFDRPLSISGRVVVRTSDMMQPREIIFDYKKNICTIPHLAIHFNREVNEGNPLSVQNDMKPIAGYFSIKEIREYINEGGILINKIAEFLEVPVGEILDYELNLYPTEKAALVGINDEYFQSGRIDDLSMAFAGLEALLSTADKETPFTRILAIFDNEETGSGTKQGAGSPVLRDMMERVARGLGENEEGFLRMQAQSFMISADDAHAWHPNYNHKYDPTNHAVIGGGPVIKINSNCKYMTDGFGSAVFKGLCEKAGVKYQMFVNHSNIAGGSTLGNILTSQMDIKGVDIGAPIWAMHSARETAGVSDHLDMIKVFETFWRLEK